HAAPGGALSSRSPRGVLTDLAIYIWRYHGPNTAPVEPKWLNRTVGKVQESPEDSRHIARRLYVHLSRRVHTTIMFVGRIPSENQAPSGSGIGQGLAKGCCKSPIGGGFS